MLKRSFDLVISLPGSLISAPVVLLLMFLIWCYDRSNPLYVPHRIGYRGKPFPVYKLRTMIVDADKTGVDTTIKGDHRLLPFGEILRRYKLDELPQFWNVLTGSMSLVGPRPNVAREVSKYSQEELRLLNIKPGLTDLSSIVFSDLAERIAGAADANQAYETMIRPTKSRLALFYVDHGNVSMDLVIVLATAISILNRPLAVRMVRWLLLRYGAPADLRSIISGVQN